MSHSTSNAAAQHKGKGNRQLGQRGGRRNSAAGARCDDWPHREGWPWAELLSGGAVDGRATVEEEGHVRGQVDRPGAEGPMRDHQCTPTRLLYSGDGLFCQVRGAQRVV